MRVLLLFVAVLAASTAVGLGQDKMRPPQGGPPQFCLASAAEEKSQVIIRVSLLKPQTQTKLVDGKEVQYQAWVWDNLEPLTLGKTVRAYQTDGKLAQPAAVLKALAKPSSAVSFVRFGEGPEVVPDPFYLGALRDGSVALAFNIKPAMPIVALPQPGPVSAKGPEKKDFTKAEREEKIKALLAAAAKGDYGRVAALAKEGIGIDEQNEEGQTALMQAAANGHGGLAEELLVRHKANPKLTNKAGKTAEELARGGGHTETAGIIAKHTK